MKKMFLFISLLFTFGQVSAQHDYVPLAIENAHWIYYNSDDDGLPPFTDFYFGYKIQGDIEIDGTWYKKVYYRKYIPVINKWSSEQYLSVNVVDEYLFGAIRDDIPNRKVYGVQFCDETPPNSCPCNQEFLMYDFDMNISDNFDDFCLNEGGGISLVSITEENLFDENRLLYHMTDDWAFFLEGIGGYSPYSGYNSFGLFNGNGTPFGCPCTDFIRYCIGPDEECLDGFIVLDSDEYNLQNEISIFPNPVTDIIYIDNNSTSGIKRIQVYDVIGKLAFHERINLDQINVSLLKSGVYLVKIKTDRGVISKKVVKI